MQQRKFTSLCFAFIVVVCVMFASSQVMAASTTCRTVEDGPGQYITINAVTAGGFPLYFADNNADTLDPTNRPAGYCGNTDPGNYPCTVFPYESVSTGLNANHLYATIPVCPDDQLKLLNYSYYPICNPGTEKFGDTLTCNMKSIFLPDGGGSGGNPTNPNVHTFYLAFHTPMGKTVGLGVNNMILAKSGSTTTFFACTSENQDTPGAAIYSSGILGPSCYTPVPSPNCDPPSYTSQTTNMCLPDVNGLVVKLDVDGRAITAVYECPTTDKSCQMPTCDPLEPNSTCVPAANCVKKETYDVEVVFYDAITDQPLNQAHAFQIKEVGGTVEEAVGYFVVSDGDPTIYCLTGVGGNTICVCSGSKCPQQ